MIGSSITSYPVKGKIEYIPSKLSESIGTRVYSKLRKPYGIFFRNPSMSGVYSENLEPGEIEFVFSVKNSQIPFVGGIKILNLIPHTSEGTSQELLYIRELQYASYEYTLMSKDLSCNFNDISDSQSRRPWDINWDIDEHKDISNDNKDLYPHLQGSENELVFGKDKDKDMSKNTVYYKFRLWLEQRRKAYYEGYKCNRNVGNPYNPYSWRIYINIKEKVCFNEIKLELAKEYWWMQRIGFVKVPISIKAGGKFEYKTNDNDLNTVALKIKATKGANSTEMSLDYRYSNKDEQLINLVSKSNFTNCIIDMSNVEGYDANYKSIALNFTALKNKIDNTISKYNIERKKEEVVNNIGQGAKDVYNGGYSKDGKWCLTNESIAVEDIYKNIIPFDEDMVRYQDYYFMSSDNDDDNNELIKAYIDSFFKTDGKDYTYKGGIVNIQGKNYLKNMEFKKPFDIQSNEYKEVVDIREGKYTTYKCKVKMDTPGELYYIGVMLLHKQYMLTGANGMDAKLNSDIVVIPMVSRPNVPDWVDDEGTMKDFLNGYFTSDRDSAVNLFTLSCLSNISNNTDKINVRQIAGKNYEDIKDGGELGDVWHISLTEEEAEKISKKGKEPINANLSNVELTSEGVVILKGNNTSNVELGLIWTLPNNYTEISYEQGKYNPLKEKGKSENSQIMNFNNYDVYIQAPYYDEKNYKAIHYIKLLRRENYKTAKDNGKTLYCIDDYGDGISEDFMTDIAYEDETNIIDTVELSINNRKKVKKEKEELEQKNVVYKIENIFKDYIKDYSSIIRVDTQQYKDTQPMAKYEYNNIQFPKQKFILAKDNDINLPDDNNINGDTSKSVSEDANKLNPIPSKEITNRMVRKFYIFYAEMIEDDYKMLNEPLDISNRDWVEDDKTYRTEQNFLEKFSRARRYVIKRFNNDGIIPNYKLKYERWVVFENKTEDDKDTPNTESASENYTTSSKLIENITPDLIGNHGCSIILKSEETISTVFKPTTNTTKETIEGNTYYKVNFNGTSIWLSLNSFEYENGNPDNLITKKYEYDGTNILKLEDNKRIVCSLNDLYDSSNGKVVIEKDVNNVDKKIFIIDDLTINMNTSYKDFDNPGTRHYRCSYSTSGNNGGYVRSGDCYLIRDSISIVEPNFETAKQRCYCICSVIETDNPAMNFWTYTNRAEYYSVN